MASPAFIFDDDDFGRSPLINVDTPNQTAPDDAPGLERYIVLQRIGLDGQLPLTAPNMWNACLQALSDVRGPTGWQMHAGPTEAIWDIRTPANFESLKWQLEFRVLGGIAWALYRVRDGLAYRSGWENEDWMSVHAALEAWAEEQNTP